MQKLIISLGIIPLGLGIGQILKILVEKKVIKESIPMAKYIMNIQNITMLGLNPLIAIGAFWIVKIENIKLIIIPILGILALALGGVFGFIAIKLMRLERKQAGAFFVSASFTNLGTFGGLICYIFFGESSYAFVSMYKLLEELYYYTIGYPIAKAYGGSSQKRRSILSFILDPYILVALVSIAIGTTLNLSGIGRPDGYLTLNNILIPVSSLLLVTSVGFKVKVAAVGGYIKESLVISMIKFIFVPLVITSMAYFLGVGELSEGLVLKIVFVLSSMSPAFSSLIPPQIYNLDIDLANSSWLVNTGILAVVVPILYIIQNNFL